MNPLFYCRPSVLTHREEQRVDTGPSHGGGRGRGEHMPWGGTCKGAARLTSMQLAAFPKIRRQRVGNIRSLSGLEKFLHLNLKEFECISERV